jgi:hypothetical protein
MNKLLDSYCRMLYFCKGKPTNLSTLSNWELNGILLHINKYPQGLLNGYHKEEYITAVKYILNERLHCRDYKRNIIETRLANKALETSKQLTDLILQSMINTEKKSRRKLILT